MSIAGEEHGHHDDHDHHDELGFEDHGAHTHGHAKASISYVDGVLKARLTLAAIDVFGFEHIPKNESEKETVISNLLYLEDIENVLTTNPACALQNTSVNSDNLPMKDNGAESHELAHSDVNTFYELHCSSDIQLTFVLLEKYSSIEKIAVEFVSSSEQHVYTVTHDHRSIKLHK